MERTNKVKSYKQVVDRPVMNAVKNVAPASKTLRRVKHYPNLPLGVDHFSFKKVGKKIGGFLKDTGKIVANTVISPVKGVAKVVSKVAGKDGKRVKAWGFNNPSDFSTKFAGKLGTGIQKVTDVVLPIAGVAAGGLALAGGGSIAAGAAKLGSGLAGIGRKIKGGVQNIKSGKSGLNPKAPVGSAPEGVTAGKIKALASKISESDIKKGINLLKRGSKPSPEQKIFAAGATDVSRLPKTKSLKDAETLLTLPQESTGSDEMGFWATVRSGFPA
jgi:hypothetical protein